MISMIAAVSANGVIGSGGAIPWNIPEDMAHFREITYGSPVIMGRRTYESIGRPLPGRYNIVVTSDENFSECHARASSISQAISIAQEAVKNGSWHSEIFLIGGGRIYSEGIGIAGRIYLTELYDNYDGDAYFPEISTEDFRLTDVQDRPKLRLRFCVYDRKRADVC